MSDDAATDPTTPESWERFNNFCKALGTLEDEHGIKLTSVRAEIRQGDGYAYVIAER